MPEQKPAEEYIGAVLAKIEERLARDIERMTYAEKLALEHAHQHGYEMMHWLTAARNARGGILLT